MAASQASAQLLNVSSGAIQSQNFATVSCTVVGAAGSTWRGLKVLAIMSEANSQGSNPVITARSLDTSEAMSNDTWNGPYVYNGQTYAGYNAAWFNSMIRAPGSPNDAALFLSTPPGSRICVWSSEASGGDTLRAVALSITDVTDAAIRALGKSKSADAAAPARMSAFTEAMSASNP